MMDTPIVPHISQLVLELRSGPDEERGEAGEDKPSSVSTEESPVKNAPLTPESIVSDDESKPQRKPRRVHRVGHGKPKRRRKNDGSHSPRNYSRSLSPVLHEHKISVDAKLGGTDPFGAFELPKDNSTDMALHHWANVFQNTRMPITPRQAWMKINLSDKTLLSVTTYCSTYHFYFIRGMRAPPSCLPLKMTAIRNINNTLRRPGAIPSDYVMVAVAVMSLLECLAGEPRECVIHRKGLQLMVRTRGGLERLGLDGAAQRTISWADTCCAILLRIKPTLKPILITNAGESAIPGFSIGNLSERLTPLTSSPSLTKPLLYTWLRLRYLTEFLSTAPPKSSKIDDSFFSDKLDSFERQIISLLHSEELGESGAVAFLTALLNASLIFVYEELRECPKWNNVSVVLGERIMSGLQMVELDGARAWCPDVLLWVLMLGRSGCSPLHVVNRKWYEREIAEVESEYVVEVPNSVAGLRYFELAEETRKGRRQGGEAG